MTEEELYNTKWWDYRPLTTTEATVEFIKQYIDALNWHNERIADSPFLGSYILKQIDFQHPETWKHWETMTKIRQYADRHYMDYESFWAMSFMGKIELKMSSPYLNVFLNQRLQSWVLNRYEKQRSEEENAGIIRRGKSPFFAPENYIGHHLQNSYYEHLFSFYMRYKRNREEKGIRELISAGKIPEEYLRKRAGLS